MKSNLLRIVIVSIASAVLLRAVTGIPPSGRSVPDRAEDFADDGQIVVWGLMPCGPASIGGASADAMKDDDPTSHARDLRVAGDRRAESDDDISSANEQNNSADEPVFAFHAMRLQFESIVDAAGTGLLDIGTASPPRFPTRKASEGEWDDDSSAGEVDVGFWGPNGWVWGVPGSSESRSNIRLKGVEISQSGQIILIGSGLANARPVGISGSDFWAGVVPVETRLVLVGGPAAMDALDRSVEAAMARPSECDACSLPPRNGNAERWRDFFAGWHRDEPDPPIIWGGYSERPLVVPEKAIILNLVAQMATSKDGRHLVIAFDDGVLHLCSNYSGNEICRLKQSANGDWRVVSPRWQPTTPVDSGDTAPQIALGPETCVATPDYRKLCGSFARSLPQFESNSFERLFEIPGLTLCTPPEIFSFSLTSGR